MDNILTVPIHLKMTLTAREAAEYSNIGINKIDSMLRSPNCPFVLFVGTKKLVKRREFELYNGNLKASSVRRKNTKKLVAVGAIWYNYNVALGPIAAAQKMRKRAAAKPSVLETQFLRWIKEM